MPQRNRIKYTPAAIDDMDEIFSYISQDNVVSTETLLGKINGGITRLVDFPIWVRYCQKMNILLLIVGTALSFKREDPFL
ncbi:type II toxin-antitoxin system RelE/ParE family toxin [Candidatus Contubernalis alkaliaceticus]|uniref:type II toxin-antitoxin system RelE/ParE family toxin n=1 Tax=Candidatus Contubernalis alkaliaceticus TaxID=338645 RepID=UPI001F4C27D2|nr:type II toxin-antitoxin system RelE/ParE family toxin [Candidatus Contubernalis alkalaceticus]